MDHKRKVRIMNISSGRSNPKRLYKDENKEKKMIQNSNENCNLSPSISHSNVEINSLKHSSIEIDEIEKQSKHTKLEIENLKSELEKLINDNIKLKEIENDFTFTKNTPDRNIDVSNENMESQSIPTKCSPNKRPLKKKPIQSIVETPKVEKIKHYDPKSAREFMRKQKLQRQNKLQEEIRFKIALQEEKRKKLKELQDKTMKILYNKNKSKSFKNKKKFASSHKDEDKYSDRVSKPTNVTYISDSKLNDCLNICSNSSQKIDHIDVLETIRSSTKNEIALVTPNCHLITEPSLEDRNLAAIKIQSAYRGYKQRLKYQQMLQNKRTNNADLKQQFEKVNADELLKKSVVNSSTSVPSWLQPATVLPYPYNFITAVKQKLNLALYGYQYQKKYSTSTNLTSNTSINNEYFEKSTEENDKTASKIDNLYPHGLDAETIRSEIKSMQSVVSELKLDLRGLHSATNSENYQSVRSGENITSGTSDVKSSNKKSSESKKIALNTPIQESILPSPVESPNSTGNDIESAILSASEHIPFQCTSSHEQVISSNIENIEISSTLDYKTGNSYEVNSKLQKKSNGSVLIDSNITSEISSNANVESNLLNLAKAESSIRSYASTFVSPQNAVNQRVSESSSSPHLTAAEQLIRPKDKLHINTTLAQNITNMKSNIVNKPQEINLKFEAEIKLLETFRESLKQIAADNAMLLRQCIKNSQEVNKYTQTSFIKADVEIKNSNKTNSSIKLVQSAETENTSEHIPSIPLDENNTNSIKTLSFNNENSMTDITKSTTKTISDKKLSKSNISKKFEEKLPFINYKRGSGEISKEHIEKKLKKTNSNNLQISNISENNSSIPDSKITNELEVFSGNMKGFSLEMIDQQIRNEDIQLEHFKTLLKIREKALIDRTKGELAWLEITKKQLREKGNIIQASTIKKKQRALILRLQQEKHEMERLKLMHKASCEERKIMLKEQKNIIKKKLSTKDMLKQLKKSRTKEVKSKGPMKVYDIQQRGNDSVTTYEDPTNQQSYSVSEEFSIRSRSVVNSQSEIQSEVESIDYRKSVTVRSSKTSVINDPEKLKLSLLKKEEELKRRREKVEELLQWHQRLTEEEKQVAALEEEARKLTLRNEADDIIYSFSGIYLNTIWFNITRNKEKKYEDTKRYFLSKIDIDSFYEDAKKEVLGKMNHFKNIRSLSLTSSSLDNSLVPKAKQANETNTVSCVILKETVSISDSLPKSKLDNVGNNTPQVVHELEQCSDSTLKIDGESISLESEIKSSKTENKISKQYDEEKSLKNIENLKEITSHSEDVSEIIDLHNKTVSTSEEISFELDEISEIVNETEIKFQSQAHDKLDKIESNMENIKDAILDSPKDLSESDFNKNDSITSKKSLSEQFLIREEINERNFHKLSSSFSDSKKDESNFLLEKNVLSQNFDKIEAEIDKYVSPSEQLNSFDDTENNSSIKSLTLSNKSEHSHILEETGLENNLSIKLVETSNEIVKSNPEHLSKIQNHSEDTTNTHSDLDNSNISSAFTLEEVDISNKSTKSVPEQNFSKEKEFVINSSSSNSALDSPHIEGIKENISYVDETRPDNDAHSNKSSISVSENILKSNISEESLTVSNHSKTGTLKSIEDNINLDEISINSNIRSVNSNNFESPEILNVSTQTTLSENNLVKPNELTKGSTDSSKNKSLNNDTDVESTLENDDLYNENSADCISNSSPLHVDNSISGDSSSISDTKNDEVKTIENLNSEINDGNNLEPIISEYDNSKDSSITTNDIPNEIENTVEERIIHQEDDTFVKNDVSPLDLNDTDSTPNYSQDDENYTTSNPCSKDSLSSDFNLISETDLNLKFEKSQTFDDIIPFKNDITLLENISMPEVIEDITSNSCCNGNQEDIAISFFNDSISTNESSSDKDNIEEQIVINETENNILNSTKNELSALSNCVKTSTNQLIVNEAEELLRKQLEIELEIKELEKQQQSEIVPYVYVREIPNKPPPPYKPPTLPKIEKYSIPSSSDQLTNILMKMSNVLYTAHTNNSLNTIEPSAVFENSDNDIENNYNKFLFDLCKEITFSFLNTNSTNEIVPSWMKPTSKRLYLQKQNNKRELEKVIISKVNEYLGFSVTPRKDNLIICWSRKKRDHVDELLVKESQAEESEWTNFECDEVAVKNELTSDIFDLLLNDTISIIRKINAKKNKDY